MNRTRLAHHIHGIGCCLVACLLSGIGATVASGADEGAAPQVVDPLNPTAGVIFRADQVVPPPEPPPQPLGQATPPQLPGELYIRALPDGSLPPGFENPPPGVIMHVIPFGEE